MPANGQHTDSAFQQGLFPLSPEMLRRLFAAYDAQAGHMHPPATPENEDA